MSQTLIQNWWLLAMSGVLDAILRKFGARSTVVSLGKIALAAGACTIAGGIWNSRNGKSWPQAPNGLALSALGLICMFWQGRLTFLTVALIFVVMAMSLGVSAWRTALTERRHVPDRWSLALAGAAWIGFDVFRAGVSLD